MPEPPLSHLGLLHRLMRRLACLAQRVREGRELGLMTERELRDIGTNRYEIARRVR